MNNAFKREKYFMLIQAVIETPNSLLVKYALICLQVSRFLLIVYFVFD